MTEANKMKQTKEEKQKMVVVKKKGNLGEKLEEVRKRHERETRVEAGMEHAIKKRGKIGEENTE